jgi:hypothetical protein
MTTGYTVYPFETVAARNGGSNVPRDDLSEILRCFLRSVATISRVPHGIRFDTKDACNCTKMMTGFQLASSDVHPPKSWPRSCR